MVGNVTQRIQLASWGSVTSPTLGTNRKLAACILWYMRILYISLATTRWFLHVRVGVKDCAGVLSNLEIAQL